MKLYEVRDVVREHVGRDKLSDPMLDWCVRRGLREIEKHGNFYWMETNKIFEIIDGQQEYVLSDFGMQDFKASEVLLATDRTETDPKPFEIVGPEMIQDTKPNFTETEEGQPAFFTIREDGDTTHDQPSILLYPPLPDQNYRAQWFYFRWTELPIDARSDSHEVLRRWPEALIYLATEQAMIVSTKDLEAGVFWKSLFINPNPIVNSEYKRIKQYHEQRHQRQRIDGRPSSGTTTLPARSAAGQKGWF